MTQKCDKCKRNYRTLTYEGICYSCHIDKYKISPTEKQFGNNEVKKK